MNALTGSSTTIKSYTAIDVKPNAAKTENAYREGVRPRKRVYYEKARSNLQALFVRRLNELMADRGLSDNQLAKLIEPKAPGSIQRSVSRVTGCTQDPTLEMVGRIVDALDIPVIALFTDEPVRERTEIQQPILKGSAKGLLVNPALRNRTRGKGS